jgi:putative tricarboxylic transport membrane protein
MRVADLATSIVLLALGAIVLLDALRLGIGWGSDGPKSGFFPFWLAVIMMTASAAIVVQAARRPDTGPFVTREQLTPVLKMLVPVMVFVFVMAPPAPLPGVGLYVATALYVAVYMRWIGRHPWWLTLVVSIGIPLVTFVVFERWFLVPMPKGPLEAWLGY